MIDKKIGKRIKERSEQLGYTQEKFAEKLGVSINYLSTIERGASFPRCERLIALLNALEAFADEIFCDVLTYTSDSRSSILSEKLSALPTEDKKRILDIVERMIKQAGDGK